MTNPSEFGKELRELLAKHNVTLRAEVTAVNSGRGTVPMAIIRAKFNEIRSEANLGSIVTPIYLSGL